MEFRKIFLYNVLPKKRLLIAFIGFLISSTIITGVGILTSSIVGSTSTYLGESDNVLVISNPDASTPYTSILPLDLADTINSLEGVIEISPEVMTAAVYKKKAVYFRGVDVSKFWTFTEVLDFDGVLPGINDTFEVSIGGNFAARNNLGRGDYFTLFSTKSDSAIELRIKSIFYTGTLLDDEIVASLWIGQFFAFETYDYITHIRAKIDLELIPNKEILRELVTSEYTLATNILTPTSMQEVNATIYIRNRRGDLVNETVIYNDDRVIFQLLFGEYEIQAEIEGVLSESRIILLNQDTTLDIFVPYIKKEISFRIISDEDDPIIGAIVTVFSQREEERFLTTRTYSDLTDLNGETTFIISNGSYYGRITYGVYNKVILFDTIENTTIEVILVSRHPVIYVKNPLNFSTVIGQELNISISATSGYSIDFYIDDDIGTLQEYYAAIVGEVVPNGIRIPFEEGLHSITIEAYNVDYILSGNNKSLNYAITKVYFYVREEIQIEATFLNVMNGSHLNPSGILILNTTICFNEDLFFRWNNDNWKRINGSFISIPEDIGIHRLALKTLVRNQNYEWTFDFVVSYSPEKVGIIGLPNFKILKEGDIIQSWFNPYYEVYYYWDNNTISTLNPDGKIDTISLVQGIHNLNLATFTGTQWYNKSYQIEIDNNPPLVSLSITNGSSITASSEITVFTNENISMIQYAWDSLAFSYTYSTNILVPELIGSHTLLVKTSDLAGNTNVTYYEFTIVNFTGSNPIDFYLRREYSSEIVGSFIELNIISHNISFLIEYRIEGQITRSGHITDTTLIFLFPGTYTLTVIFWMDLFIKRERSWNFQITNGYNSSELYSTNLNQTINGITEWTFSYYDANFTLNEDENLFLCDGHYSITYFSYDYNMTYQSSFIVDTSLPHLMVISPNKGQDGLLIDLLIESDAVQVYVKFSSDTQFQEYLRQAVLLFNKGGEHTLVFRLIDSYYNEVEIYYSFFMGLIYTEQNLTFEVKVGNLVLPVYDLDISVSSIYNSSVRLFSTDLDGNISFTIFGGKYTISYIFDDQDIELTLDTSIGFNNTMFLIGADTVLEVRDVFANSTIEYQYCIVRDTYGNRMFSQYTNSEGRILTNMLPSGDYFGHFTYDFTTIAIIPFEVYQPNHLIIMNIPSKRQKVILKFQYDNGTQIFNLPVIVSTELNGIFYTSTALSSQITLRLSYGILNITIFAKDGSILNLRRVFEPGKSTITITLPSENEEQWSKIPFKPIAGFTFLISISSEYFEYYLRSSLLFTYTLIFALILLIIIVVIVNMFSILQNMYKESKRETTIIRMIGGTNFHSIVAVFSRLGIIAVLSSIIGYGVGALMLLILANANQTVFFGHTFIPKGSWEIFLLNVGFIILIALITTVLISRKASKDKTITQIRR